MMISPYTSPTELAEALAEVCGMDWQNLSGDTRGMLNRALAQIRQMTSEFSDEELAMIIPGKAAAYRQAFEGRAALTPTALAKHWAQLDTLAAEKLAQDQVRANRSAPPSDCLTCGGDRLVLVGWQQPTPSVWALEHRSKKNPEMGLPHPAHREPEDGFEIHAPCPDCNQKGVELAREWRARFARNHY